jgi:hypothetical protein
MSTIGSFSTSDPGTGKLRIFFSQSAAGPLVRAVTLRKISKNNIDVGPSLSELIFIKASITGSGARSTFTPESIADKGNYFFIKNAEFNLDTISGSLNAPVTINPFLTTAFGNSDSNPTLSNATLQRTYSDRFDMDRSSGTVQPGNINALLGITPVTFEGFQMKGPNGASTLNSVDLGDADSSSLVITAAGTGAAVASTSPTVKEIINFEPTDFPITVQITRPELDEAFGVSSNISGTGIGTINSPNGTFTRHASFTPPGDYDLRIFVQIRLYKTTDDNNGDPDISLAPTQIGSMNNIYTEIYQSGSYVRSATIPFNGTIPHMSGSGNGVNTDGKLHIELSLRTTVDRQAADKNFKDRFVLRNLIRNNASSTKGNLKVRIIKAVQEPYASLSTVPDSNYSSTGFANARYNGTKTSAASYSGLSPAFTGKPFKAFVVTPKIPGINDVTALSSSANGENIFRNFVNQTVSSSVADHEEFLFNGENDEPQVANSSGGTVPRSTIGAVIATPLATDFWNGSESAGTLQHTIKVPGNVTSIGTITAAGSGYSNANNVTVGYAGAGTNLTVNITTNSGTVTGVTIGNNSGASYAPGDELTISGGGGDAKFLVGTTDTQNTFIADFENLPGLQVGDIIATSNNPLSGNVSVMPEKMKVVNIEPLAEALYPPRVIGGVLTSGLLNSAHPKIRVSKVPKRKLFRVTVVRDYLKRLAGFSNKADGTPIVRLAGDRVFKIEGSEAVPASNLFLALDPANASSAVSGAAASQSFKVIKTDERGIVHNFYTTQSLTGVFN